MNDTQEPIEAEIVSKELVQSVSSLGDVMTTAQLKASTKRAQEQRSIITEYVRNHLVKGVDYGTIGSFKKDVLFKPGQEKIFSLMNLTSRLEKDTDTIDMIGGGSGVVAYICRVYRKGEEIAQGRGAAKVGENGRDINSTIKIAEKRARMDACLSLGFSEFFTQDLEDPEYRGVDNTPSQPQTDRLATVKQKDLIRKKLEEQGVADEDMKGILTIDYGVTDTSKLSMQDASMIIENLISQKGNYVAHTPRGN